MTKPSSKPASTHLSDAFTSLKHAGRGFFSEAKEAVIETGQDIQQMGRDLATEAAEYIDASAKDYGERCYHVAQAKGYTEDQALAIGRFNTEYYLKPLTMPDKPDPDASSGPSTPQT